MSRLTDAERLVILETVDRFSEGRSNYGEVNSTVERILAERLAAQSEEIAQAIQHGPHRLGHDVSVVCSCLRCEVTESAARIAREATS